MKIVGANDLPEANKGLEEEFAAMRAELMNVLTSQADKKFFEAQLDGEKQTVVFAKILGVEKKSVEQQKSEIKKTRDRISKTLKRYVETKN